MCTRAIAVQFAILRTSQDVNETSAGMDHLRGDGVDLRRSTFAGKGEADNGEEPAHLQPTTLEGDLELKHHLGGEEH